MQNKWIWLQLLEEMVVGLFFYFQVVPGKIVPVESAVEEIGEVKRGSTLRFYTL
ncbi:MAG: hypothetical protein DDT40_01850 [candidate division WS2 bacterium]|uniref:Uncharacterized protein n=1 Tax=Psychracetigena formicireducens TaxID=2986056 RepID=A0A9E2BMH6_PSYF1|nr:hypothetical protein [Candidatus Psychracetigena formicireducens]MBT9145704.1 hypothetical protein [Candidatus Psychracetigena formicireducens]MBT9151654.1 hypothetical protein [Candidatus Psychracetigena formicireducens]